MKRTFLYALLVSILVMPGVALSTELGNSGAIGFRAPIAQRRGKSSVALPTQGRRNHRRISQDSPTILIGEWTNQLKSTLNIKAVDPKTGQITGTYKSGSGAGGNEFPLIGWVNSRPPIQKKDNVLVLSFSVRWGEIGSITTWAGYLRVENGVPTISAQWFLVRPNSDFLWDHILTNQDVFTKK